MPFEIPAYRVPDFTRDKFHNAPDVRWAAASKAVSGPWRKKAGWVLCLPVL